MDIATVIGLIGTFGLIIVSMFLGGSVGMFINVPSLLIVLGGSATVTFIKYPMAHTLQAFTIAMKAFFHKGEDSMELIELGIKLAGIARRDGLLGLEEVEIENTFLAKGLQLAIDGQPPDFVNRVLSKDINQLIERHKRGKNIFDGIGDTAPAMGMIGTLVGLVQMMSNMSDPKSIGPAMAVALLTTLYGAVIANVIALPLADKLDHRSMEEQLNKSLILETIRAIQSGVDPRALEDLLHTYLPGSTRPTEEEKE